jgi:AcrR family transcriptional regulator
MNSANPDTEPARPMRADARRNYERLLAEAKRAFLRHGVDASLEDVARNAGVGIGTLYRHFPSRNALLDALLRERFDSQAAAARELLGHESPIEALMTWLARFVEASTSYRGLIEPLASALGDESSDLYVACHSMRDAGDALVERAKAAGELRADVTTNELFLLVNGMAWASEYAPGGAGGIARMIRLVFAGLRRC